MLSSTFIRVLSYLAIALTFSLFGYYLGDSSARKSLSLPIKKEQVRLTENCLASSPSIQLKPSQETSTTKENLRSNLQQSILQVTVDESDDDVLQSRITSLFPNADVSVHIDDIREFANRMITELGDSDTQEHEDSIAGISFSLSKNENSTVNVDFEVSSRQKIYAHINVNGGLGASNKKFFVKWRNIDTGEILLFTPKRINSNSELNWVSLVPQNDWGDHNYEVTFYQFTSELNKLASSTYTTFEK